MKNTGKILIIIGIIFGLLSIRSVWREHKYQQVVTTAKANVLSVETKPFSGKAVASIQYKLVYQHDDVLDTISYATTEEYSIKEPLPSLEELKAVDFYVHYVPKSKQSETAFPESVSVSNMPQYESFNRFQGFGSMLVFILLGCMILYFSKNKVDHN
ncbi:hypothetical protein [Flavobacterium sp.]|uniref:hypothetical protein n=1 Tax=Flavobacterium sp. TaxID=239 RepID=UPI002611306F|nr:hypothetical protein [Flavobacterium sp.]MDD3005318.1 hypothetical protein [Flavobacterium sp.]